MHALAVVVSKPEQLELRRLSLTPPGAADAVMDIDWSGISTGTERLLWSGRMPPFPGMGYPLVPGYESVGRVIEAGPEAGVAPGDAVFVPGATCYGEVRGLFGGAASRVVVPGRRLSKLSGAFEGENSVQATLLALAATARHAIAGGATPELIVGHGVLGRLLARLVVAEGGAPVVWERNPARASGADGYAVCDPETDPRRDYRVVCDVSGDAGILDTLVAHMAPGGEIVLAGFYAERLSFAFPPAFMREARLRIAAQWQPADLEAVQARLTDGTLSLDGLVTHRRDAWQAEAAYHTAFGDPACLKMVLDWRSCR